MQSEPKTKRTRKAAEETPVKRHRAAKKTIEPKALAAAAAGTSHHTSHYQVAELAYSYWERRGFQGGSPEEDWYRAEGELRTSQNA